MPEITKTTRFVFYNNPAKMSTNPKKEESDNQKTDEVEIEMVPEGTFAGTIEKPYPRSKKVSPCRKIQGIKVEAKTETLPIRFRAAIPCRFASREKSPCSKMTKHGVSEHVK